MTITSDYQRDWPSYFEAVRTNPPRDTLLRALDLFDQGPSLAANGLTSTPRLAVDLGAGEGRDSRELLRRGWNVIAIEPHPLGLDMLAGSIPIEHHTRLKLISAKMEEVNHHPDLNPTPPLLIDLCNASFALPFCEPSHFHSLWRWITQTIRPHGRFAGQFFGLQDEWAATRPQSHYSKDEVLALLDPFEIEHFEEVAKHGPDAMGGTKFHHVFHVVARKRINIATLESHA